ncbi:hypothetical protein F2Q69_00043254 [Brassica cretica]|uniref:Uncharacterized protein n=1 Tax=Brassica cretica TaxID=69181 RepID=A0A8S9NDS1_BRACR|nr:hypothetical protein F2Q69_00043254 [Brassica cretica]
MANQTAIAAVQYKPFSTFVSAGPEDSKLMFRLIHFWMVISQKDMIAYHEHAGEASNSHPPMLDAMSNEFWEQKIVRKSNGADIYRLQRNVKKRDRIDRWRKYYRLTLNSSLASSWRRRLGVVIGVVEDIFNFRLFILERITNLKPGEEQEDPERRYAE